MDFPQWYLGVGVSRKGENLDELIVGWVSYFIQDDRIRLHFDGRSFKTTAEAVREVHQLAQPYVGIHVYYSMQGVCFYFAQEWSRKHGLPAEEKGRVIPYDTESPDVIDKRSTRLAADLDKLRRAEVEWPHQQMTFRKGINIRRQIRASEIHDDPGRGPLRRVLTAIQEQHSLNLAPVCAMAFQALRRVWVEHGDGIGLEEENQTQYEMGRGLILHKLILEEQAKARKNKVKRPEMPDPQMAFAPDQELEDYGYSGIYY